MLRRDNSGRRRAPRQHTDLKNLVAEKIRRDSPLEPLSFRGDEAQTRRSPAARGVPSGRAGGAT